MNGLLADAAFLSTFAIAPGLLLIRFFRPRILPRWAVPILAAVLGGLAFYVSELLTYSDWARRLGLHAQPMPANLDGMVVLGGPGRTEFMAGAALQICYLLLWLVPYGITRIILDRRKRVGHVVAYASLERRRGR